MKSTIFRQISISMAPQLINLYNTTYRSTISPSVHRARSSAPFASLVNGEKVSGGYVQLVLQSFNRIFALAFPYESLICVLVQENGCVILNCVFLKLNFFSISDFSAKITLQEMLVKISNLAQDLFNSRAMFSMTLFFKYYFTSLDNRL